MLGWEVVIVIPFLLDLCIAIGLIALPLFAISLGADALTLGILGFVGQFTYVALAVLFGRVSDRIGRCPFLLSAAIIYTVALLVAPACFRVAQLLVLSGVLSGAMAMFWPPFEAWIAEAASPENLRRILGHFNIAWSTGIGAGFFLGGFLMSRGVHLTFHFAGLVSLFVTFLIIFQMGPKFRKDEAKELVSSRAEPLSNINPDAGRRYLIIGWLANFGCWFTVATLRYLFPKLATDLSLSKPILGILMGLLSLVQALMFYFLSRTQKWQYRLTPLLISQGIAIFGLLILLKSSTPILLALSFLLIGQSMGVAYSSSLFYSLAGERSRGTKSGVHEAMVGTGGLFGPLLGGLAAKKYSPWAPYQLCIVVIILTILVQVMVYRSILRTSKLA